MYNTAEYKKKLPVCTYTKITLGINGKIGDYRCAHVILIEKPNLKTF